MTVGILGGGQLGLMLAESLRKLDTPVVVLEPDDEAPCAQRLAGVMERPLDDADALTEFFGRCERVTSIPRAVSHLGVALLKGLALTSEVFGALVGRPVARLPLTAT